MEVDSRKATIIGWANRMLHWEAIKYAKEKGIREFNWGGVWSNEKDIPEQIKNRMNYFKLSFGAEVVTRHYYFKAYSFLCKMAQRMHALVNR